MKYLNRCVPALRFCLGLLLIQGCSGTNTYTSEGYTRVGDVFLDNQISIDDILVDESERPKVYNVKMRNLMYFDMVLEVKMDFYDGSGVKVDNPWGWKPVTVEAKQDEWVRFTAPSDLADKFKIYVKKAER